MENILFIHISNKENKSMKNSKRFLGVGVLLLTSLFFGNCGEGGLFGSKKKDNNNLIAAALLLSQSTYNVSGQVILSKEGQKRNGGIVGDQSSFDQTPEKQKFYYTLPNATLKITGSKNLTLDTDNSGYFTLKELSNGEYQVTVTRKPNTTLFPAAAANSGYDCTGVADVNSFTLVVNGTDVKVKDVKNDIDLTTTNASYNPVWILTSVSTLVTDRFQAPDLEAINLVSEVNRVVPVDTACDRTKKDCLQSLINGFTWLMKGSEQIPPNILGLSESIFNTSSLCYAETRFIARKAQGTDAVFSVENKMGTPNAGPNNTCGHDSPVGDFTAPTVSTNVSITPVSKTCFDINISYNLVRQEGRGNISDDGKTLKLELYNGGLSPSLHRCANGEVGNTSAIPGTGYPPVSSHNNPSGRAPSAVQTYTKQ